MSWTAESILSTVVILRRLRTMMFRCADGVQYYSGTTLLGGCCCQWPVHHRRFGLRAERRLRLIPAAFRRGMGALLCVFLHTYDQYSPQSLPLMPMLQPSRDTLTSHRRWDFQAHATKHIPQGLPWRRQQGAQAAACDELSFGIDTHDLCIPACRALYGVTSHSRGRAMI